MDFLLKGLIAAPIVPLAPNGSVNLKVISRYVRLLQTNGVNGVFVNGSTGEGMSLTTQERMDIAEAWVKAASPNFIVVIHVGHACLADCIEMTRHAVKIGAHAVGCCGPNYYKPKTVAMLAEWCRSIAKEAEPLPFYYYHVPVLTGVNFNMLDLLQAVGDISNFAGIKYTAEDLIDFNQCVRYKEGKYNMLFGRDGMFLLGLVYGAHGAVGSNFNYDAPLFNKIIECFQAGKWAEALKYQEIAMDIGQEIGKTGDSYLAIKKLLGELGIDCGNVRLPLETISTEKWKTLQKRLMELHYPEWRMKNI